MFPLFGSATLFGLYLVFRFLDKTYVNYLINTYFGALGVMATTQVGVNFIAPIVKLLGIKVDRWRFTLTKRRKGTKQRACLCITFCVPCLNLTINLLLHNWPLNRISTYQRSTLPGSPSFT